jgi:ABC-2 type transport system ATP-binding protein
VSAAALLDVRGLAKRYGAVRAVDGVELRVQAGELRGLVGANGAGKSTTISCIAGVLGPDAGGVRVCGLDALRDGRRARRELGVAGQRPALYGGLAVRTNLRFFAGLASGGQASERNLDEVVEALRLGPLLERCPRDLSVGQQRLVHVATALVHRPRVLLLDEPTAALDAQAREDLLELLSRRAEQGAAVVLSTHQLADVEERCATVTLLHRGRSIASGRVGELIDRHGRPRVEVRVAGRTLVCPGQDVAAALAAAGAQRTVDSVRVIRPSLQAVFATLAQASVDASGELRA